MRPDPSNFPARSRRTVATRPAGAFLGLVLALGLGVAAGPLQTLSAAAVTTPASFTTVSAKPGPGVGEVTFTWAQSGASTTSYMVETGLTSFSTTDSSLPVHARGYKYFTFPAGVRTYTLSAAQVASAGAPVGSANQLYYRMRAVNTTSSGTATKFWPYLQQVGVKPAVPATTGTPLRVGTFNIRTARATTDNQTWMERVPAVAASLISYHPGVAALQELGPGRADGQTGTTNGTPRQTESLITELYNQGASQYKLVRTTPYVAPGTPTDTQGMRILYDSTKYTLVSPCVDKTGTSSYSPSCSFNMPLRSSGDTEDDRRRAAYAEFADKSTGDHFYFVSVHFDARHSTNLTTEATLNALRGQQATVVTDTIDAMNTNHYPVVLGGDMNTWQNNKVGYTAHDNLVADGYYDTAAAVNAVNVRYTTINHFDTTLADPGAGFGSRLDTISVKGVVGASYWENVFKNPDSLRPSDHNMLIADIRLPSQGPAGTTYQPLTPVRLLDTRTGLGADQAIVPAGGRVDLDVTGVGGVPSSGVAAVVLNVTATQPVAGGYATVYPGGVSRPAASTLNYAAGQTIANSVIVKVGSGGLVSLYAASSTHLLADVQGWFPTGSDLTSLTPARILDTRSGVGAPAGIVASGGVVKLTVAGSGGVPDSGVSAVVLNVTSTQATANGSVTVYPSGQSRPGTYSVNYTAGQSVASSVVAKVNPYGEVSLYVSAASHLVVDVSGWLPDDSDLVGLTPARLLDTRTGVGAPQAIVAKAGTVDLVVTGRGGVPATGVSTVVLTVTSVSAAEGGYLTVYPAGVTRPGSSNLNFVAGRAISNSVLVKVGDGGKVRLYVSGSTHLVADVVAYNKA